MPQFSFKTSVAFLISALIFLSLCSIFFCKICFDYSPLWLTYGLNSTQSSWHSGDPTFDFWPVAFIPWGSETFACTSLLYICLQDMAITFPLFPNANFRSFSWRFRQKQLGLGAPNGSSSSCSVDIESQHILPHSLNCKAISRTLQDLKVPAIIMLQWQIGVLTDIFSNVSGSTTLERRQSVASLWTRFPHDLIWRHQRKEKEWESCLIFFLDAR